MKSLVHCFLNLSLTFAIVTETWLAHGSRLELDTENLLLGQGLVMKCLNRPPSINGVTHGGVAIIAKESSVRLAEYDFPNPERYEVLAVTAKVANIKSKFYIIGVYIPPNYVVARGRACLNHINDLVLEIKRTAENPLIVLAGDFNQWDVQEALLDYPEVQEVLTPPTREDRRIDKIFTNFHDDISEAGCVPPLDAELLDGRRTESDHNIQYCCSEISIKEPIKWEVFTHRPYTESGADALVEDLSRENWIEVYNEPDTNSMAVRYQQIIDALLDKHFPLKTTKRKESDLPWINDVARKMIKKKCAIYKAEGKSDRWTAQFNKVEQYLEKRRQAFMEKQREKFTGPDAAKNFYRNVKAYKCAEKPKSFDIRDLRPGQTDLETATEAAAYFNRISCEFQPLEPADIPATYHRDLPLLSPAAVADLIRKAKKPNSMVQGDIFPKVMNRCASYIAWPLSAIYNRIIGTYIWPTLWKREYVTIIPKKNLPEDFSDLRNISCTMFISKIFEQYLQRCIEEEISLKSNQYGGVKGCSTTHMIIDIMQEICENAEDYRSATVLCAIDYAKAFNRLSYQHCLESFRRKGSSTPVLRLLASFLTNRTMSVRVGSCWSEPLPVNGGCPQGSILGVRLFNTTTDNLEDHFEELERTRLGLPERQQIGEEAREDPVEEFQPRLPVCSSPEPGAAPVEDPPVSPIEPPPVGDVVRRPKLKLNVVPQPVIEVPPVEVKTGTQVLTEKTVKFFKYVDDNVSCAKLNFGTTITLTLGGFKIKTRQAIPTQNAFRSVTSRAKEIGMVVNNSKTTLLCVSDALNYRPETFIIDTDGTRIECSDSMKVLGFYFSNRPTVDLHVNMIMKKLRQKYWVLGHLKRVGFSDLELVKVYRSVLLPVVDYCCPAYHSMLTDLQDQLLERTQIGALRAIFGYKNTATELRQMAGVTTLRERRVDLTDKFAQKCLTSERFRHWFPASEGRRSGRNTERYREFFAKSDRLKNSPLYYMRRRLNGKQGREYGERNRKYRENFNL